MKPGIQYNYIILDTQDYDKKFLPLIKEIAPNTFKNSDIKEINFPNVIRVCHQAFERCHFLETINLPNCEVVESKAFFLHTDIPLPMLSKAEVPENLPELKVYLPKVKIIGEAAFLQCLTLKVLNIPCCEYINKAAFQSCDSLKKVYAPNLKKIDEYSFQSCYSLYKPKIPASTVLSNSSFLFCELLNIVNLDIESIPSSCFNGCKSLKSIILPKCVYISRHSFENCKSLVSVKSPVCKKIDEWAFAYCHNLTYVYAPECEVVFKHSSFLECYKLKDIIINKKVKNLRSLF